LTFGNIVLRLNEMIAESRVIPAATAITT
jgi:hypothetical protein